MGSGGLCFQSVVGNNYVMTVLDGDHNVESNTTCKLHYWHVYFITISGNKIRPKQRQNLFILVNAYLF